MTEPRTQRNGGSGSARYRFLRCAACAARIILLVFGIGETDDAAGNAVASIS